jgi:hypothetical protein
MLQYSMARHIVLLKVNLDLDTKSTGHSDPALGTRPPGMVAADLSIFSISPGRIHK